MALEARYNAAVVIFGSHHPCGMVRCAMQSFVNTRKLFLTTLKAMENNSWGAQEIEYAE